MTGYRVRTEALALTLFRILCAASSPKRTQDADDVARLSYRDITVEFDPYIADAQTRSSGKFASHPTLGLSQAGQYHLLTSPFRVLANLPEVVHISPESLLQAVSDVTEFASGADNTIRSHVDATGTAAAIVRTGSQLGRLWNKANVECRRLHDVQSHGSAAASSSAADQRCPEMNACPLDRQFRDSLRARNSQLEV